MSALIELRKKLGALTDKLNTPEVIADAKAFDAAEAEITALEGEIARTEKAQARSAAAARPVGGASGLDPAFAPPSAQKFDLREIIRSGGALSPGHATSGLVGQIGAYFRQARAACISEGVCPEQLAFRSFGEQLQAIARSSLAQKAGSGQADPRLVRAPSGASEVDPTGGGFLVQTDFATAIFALAHDMGEILGRVRKIPIAAESNGLKLNAVDETSRATGSRWGGVQSYWIGEGTTVPTSKPKFRRLEFDLKKLFSLAYLTEELLQDATALTAILAQAFSEELVFMTEDGIFEGTGAGQPLGILNAPALIAVAKVVGQPAASITKENVDAVWSRLWARSRRNSVWLINQDALPQLMSLGQVVGTGGAPVYLPPGGYSASPYATLLGRPVIETEYSAALGTTGDILLADLSQYILVDKGGVQAANSMHVAFLTDEMVFRFTYRVDGQPAWKSPITPFKGTNTRSPFIGIAAR